MHRLATALVIVGIGFICAGCGTDESPSSKASSGTTSTKSAGFTLSESTSTGIEGVSTGTATVNGTVYIYPTTGADRGVGVYKTDADGGVERVGSVGLDRSSDATIVATATGYRMYYATPAASATPQSNGPTDKAMSSATSTDGITWTSEGVRIADVGWGVPDVTKYADGLFRVWWVEPAGGGDHDEKLLSATSTDGLTFTRDDDAVLDGDWVDSAVIQAEEGDYVMLVSNTPDKGLQQLFVATSTDGITWTVDPTPIGNGFDPAAVKTGKNTWRMWWSEGGGPASGTPVVKTGVLTRKA